MTIKNSLVLVALFAAVIGTPVRSLAQDSQIPGYLEIPGLEAGGRCNSDAFKKSFHTKGERSVESNDFNQLSRVCPTKRYKWNGNVIRINWIDGKGRAFTDCYNDGSEDTVCWITVSRR